MQTSPRASDSEPAFKGADHLLETVPQRVFGQRASPGILADGPSLLGVGEIVVEHPAALSEIAIDDDLVPGLEEGRQIVLEVDDLAGGGCRELEGPRVDTHDVVHRVMLVERQ